MEQIETRVFVSQELKIKQKWEKIELENAMFFKKKTKTKQNKTKLGTGEIAIFNPQTKILGLTELDFEISSLWLAVNFVLLITNLTSII